MGSCKLGLHEHVVSCKHPLEAAMHTRGNYSPTWHSWNPKTSPATREEGE